MLDSLITQLVGPRVAAPVEMSGVEMEDDLLLGSTASPKRASHAAKLGVSLALTFFFVGYGGSHLSSLLLGDASSAASSTLASADAALVAISPVLSGNGATSSQAGGSAAFLVDEGMELPPMVTDFLAEDPDDTDPRTHVYRLSQDRDAASALDVKVTNSYTELAPVQTGRYGYPWTYMAEPYRPSQLTVVGAKDDGWYKWIVDGHTQGYGSTVGVLFTSIGYKPVIMVEKYQNTTTLIATKVMVKYTRREIRSLNDLDRELFFSAVMTMQRVPTEVGQRLYGSKYKSKDYFNRVHLYYGGTADCDHWHQGAGFVTSHMAFTLEFEQTLQSVNPSLSVPYWDFTIESTFYEPHTWRSSPIFADDWFGIASPDNDLHTVSEGRWAFVPSMTHAWEFSEVHNSYGVLRAPWNNDPTPFMTRHDHIYGYMNNMKPSGCKEYVVAMKKTTWMSMSRQLNAAAHGHIHETVGGSWNHFFAEDNAQRIGPAILTFAHEMQALSKELWRKNYVTCPSVCSMDTPWRECQCECSTETLAGKTAYEVLDDSGVLDAVQYFDQEGHLVSSWKDENGTVYYTLPGYSEEQSHHIYDDLLKTLCSVGHIGDMFQATSTNDITFWVLHPTVDRLWHFKRLGNQDNYDETWDPYHTCYGHNPTNFQPFKNLFDDNDVFYTNQELYDHLRPDRRELPYAYDNFKWPHCELVGYDITNES